MNQFVQKHRPTLFRLIRVLTVSLTKSKSCDSAPWGEVNALKTLLEGCKNLVELRLTDVSSFKKSLCPKDVPDTFGRLESLKSPIITCHPSADWFE